MEIDYSKDSTVKHRTTKKLINFDCVNRKAKTLQTIMYAPSGEIIDSWDDSEAPTKYRYVAPDTVLEGALTSACPSKRQL